MRHIFGKKFYLIHIPKTGGTSLGERRVCKVIGIRQLSENYRNRYVTQNGTKIIKNPRHARLVDICNKIRCDYEFVAVVRNPWSRVVSQYKYFWASREMYANHRSISPDASFSEFVEVLAMEKGRDFGWHSAAFGCSNQKEYVTDEFNNVPVHILRFESLQNECERFFDTDLKLRNRNKSTVVGNRSKPYADYYCSTTKRIVQDMYGEDIEYFGFGFESSATRNTEFS